MFFSARNKSGWLAILLQEATVTLAHVVREPGSPPRLRRLERFAAEGGAVEALQRLRSARELKSYRCTTLLGGNDYSIMPLDAPAVPREERREALRWALKEMVAFPVDSACVDVLDLPAAGSDLGRPTGVLAVAAPESAVRACVAPFEAAGVALACVDIAELAQRNVAALLEDNNRGLAFLRVDEYGTMLTLTFHGELVAVRRGDMNTRQLSDADAETRERGRERLILELQRSLDNFDRQYSQMPVSKVVLACHPRIEGLAAVLGESSYVPVHEMDLAAVLDFGALPAAHDTQLQARDLLAIGAALRTGGGTA